MKMDEDVKAAIAAHKQSGLAVIKAVEKAYPVGSILNVTIGRSTFPVRVGNHSKFWWSSPGEMVGTNLNTGKTRRFTPDDVVGA